MAKKVRGIVPQNLKDKFNEAVVGSVLFIIAAILYKAQLNGLFDAIESNVKIFLIVIMIAFFFLGIGLLVICVRDILNILPLFNEGSFVELESKSEWLDKFGEIYKIKGKRCPYCETQPIGKMFLNKSFIFSFIIKLNHMSLILRTFPELVERVKPFYEVFLHPKTLKIEGLRENQDEIKKVAFRG